MLPPGLPRGALRVFSWVVRLIISTLFSELLPAAMASLGFRRSGRHYRHPECRHLFVEFPPGPLALGEDTRIKPLERDLGGVVMKILSPTDCIRDRLASYIHFKSRDSLEQALLVGRAQPFDLHKVKSWCESEGSPETFVEFQRVLARS